jgi:hypothetical protein
LGKVYTTLRIGRKACAFIGLMHVSGSRRGNDQSVSERLQGDDRQAFQRFINIFFERHPVTRKSVGM